MIKRQLTYYIPLAIMSQTSAIQNMITKEVININGSCHVTFESKHTASEVFSTMVLTTVCYSDRTDYIHCAIQKVIALTMKLYSPTTDTVHVTDIPIMARDFTCEEIL